MIIRFTCYLLLPILLNYASDQSVLNKFKKFQCPVISDQYFSFQGDTLKAKIGVCIIEGSELRMAKMFDRVHKGDNLKVYVNPFQKVYAYIINKSGDSYSLVTKDIILKNKNAVLPSNNSFYQIDGEKPTEEMVILLSLRKEHKFEDLFITNSSDKLISETIGHYIEICKVINTDEEETVIPIGGNVRDPKFKNLKYKSFLGLNYIIKNYYFDVKK